MLQSCLLINARIIGYPDLKQLEINAQGQIVAIIPQALSFPPEESTQVLDLEGDWLSLGGLDLQINGGLGIPFSDLTKADLPRLQKLCEYLWSQGVDLFCPTIITTSLKKIRRSLAVIRQYKEEANKEKNTSEILGVHLEGPFLNFEKRGAHPSKFLLGLNAKNVEAVLGDDADLVRIITLAPELDSKGTMIPYLTNLGITVSLGHSQATEEQARAAFDLGASMVTHAFNAMPYLHHRHPGLLAAAILNPQVYCGLIADGKHVARTMMDILLRACNYEQGVFLVSDALAPLGLPPGIYPWDDRQIEVKHGTARLTDGTLSGTTLPLLSAVSNLIKWKLCPPQSAIALATHSPYLALSRPTIGLNQPAQFLRWHYDSALNTLKWQRFG